jgi:hypothetical protein
MPRDGTNWFDILLFAGLAVLLGGVAFVSAVEGWRRWSENRRLKEHFRSPGKHRRIVDSPPSIPTASSSPEQHHAEK